MQDTVGAAAAEGKARRKQLQKRGDASWRPELRKRDPSQILQEASRGRLTSLLPLKRERMSANPFTFYRGAAAVMAYDLSLQPHTGITTQLCGDAHVQNLGAYEGIDGKLIFDINDFDETICGPFEWDVKRMATSILLAGQQAKVGAADSRSAAVDFLHAYSALMQEFAAMPVLQVARYQVRRVSATAPLAKVLGKAERASATHLRDKLTEQRGSKRIFRTDAPVLRRITGSERQHVLGSLAHYRDSLLPERRHFFDQFQPVDAGFKVVGIGSVGTRDYCVYLQGNGPDDPMFLQIKQEVQSVYAEYLPHGVPGGKQQGRRVADGQRAMQLQSDPMLGWTRFDGRDYLVRQLNDHKASLDATTLNARGLAAYSSLCGEMLARGHARAGDARLISGYIGGGKAFRKSILQFACAYAEQTTRDWKLWCKSK